jgi:hypothetical protein
MTDIHEATVEVLTAEVRVLMVGSRQVTLSVYGQLDLVRPDHIEPFGRVSRKPHCRDAWDFGRRVSPDCPGDCVDVVGRSLNTGALVRSCGRRGSGSFFRECGAWDALPLIVLAGLR